MTLEHAMKSYGWKGEGEVNCSRYIEICKTEFLVNYFSNDTFQEGPSGSKVVDVSGRDMSHLDGLDEALGLVGKRLHGDLTFEEIRDKIKPIDAKRDKEYAANVDLSAVVAERSSSLKQIEVEGLPISS